MEAGGLFEGITLKEPPLQMVSPYAGITGPGLTVTVTVNTGPVQLPDPPEVGVTVYVAV